MRSKDKPASRSEILRNFTREFLIEEKRRCEIDRYVTDFRILIHSRPHENHNYLNRLLQDYTNMFLAHERISANRLNQDEMKYQLKSQLASRKKDSPKQRYVQSKLSHKNDKNHEHQSYLVLKAKTEEFLKKIRQYDELEQIAYEIFVKNSEMKTYEPNTVLKLKSSDDIPLDIPYKKHYRNVYTVNSPKDNKNNENYEFIKEQTEKFLSNNRDYNDAEQKILSEQYQKNPFIKKYVDSLTHSAKSKNDPQSPKRGIYSKIKTMIGFSPEKSTKFYKTLESNLGNLTDNTKIFLRNERKYNNFEFEAYKLFYIKNGEFQNPLIEKIKQIAYETQKDSTDNPKKIKIKHLVGMKNARNQDRGNSEKEEFEDYNLVKCSPPANNEPESKMKDIHFQFQSPKQSSGTAENTNKIQTDVDFKYRLKNINEFLEKQKLFEDQQRYYYVIHMRKHHINPVKERKEGLFAKIKHLFFGKNEKSKEKTKYFKDITQEFLKNEQYFYDLETQGHIIFSGNKSNRNALILTDSRSLESPKIIAKRISQDSSKKSPEKKSVENKVFEETASLAEKSKTSKKREKSRTSPPSLHQRSRSEDLLMFKTRTKSLDGNKSPTGHKTFSDRLKSMVGIGNRRRTKSRDNILRISDPVQSFIEHERFYYDGVPKIDKKYARSISSIEHMPKDGTIKTKTKKFLSTENVLYQDNSNVVGKPPTGRRRRDERNRDSKERRRSRTLSPAQKLVSKIRNLVHKNDKQKEDPNLEGNEMSSSDDKGPNNQLEATSVKTDDSLQEKHIKKDNSNNQKNASVNKSIVAEKKADINNLDPEFMKNQTRIFLQDIKKYHDLDKGPDTVDKTLIFINNKSKSTPVFVSTEVKSMDGKEDVGSSKLKLVESNNITHHKYSTTETRQKVVRNTIIKESVITQRTTTEKIQKECIEEFPTQDTKSNTNIETKKISIEFSPNEEHFYENMFVTKDGLSESNPMQSSKEEEYSAQTGRNINNYSKSHSTYSETKGIDESENTIIEKDEKIHLPRTIEEKVQNSKETNITYEQGHLRKMISIKTETQREPTNKSLDEFPSVMDPNGKLIKIKNDEYLERQQRLEDEMKKLSRERKNMNTAMSEVAVEVAPKNIENSSVKHKEPKKKAQDPVEIIKKEQILIAAEKQSSANKRLAKFPEKEEKPKKELKKTQIPQKVIKEEVIIEAAEKQSSAPKRLEKSPEKEEKPKKGAFSKLKTFVSRTSKKPTAEESNKLLRQQTSEFLDDMRKNHDYDKDAMAKYKIVWLEEKKVTATKVPKQQSEPVKLVAISEKEKQRLKLIRQNTDNFLKDHQDYHNRQRKEDNQFFTKVGQPEHLIWLSSRPAKKKDNIITKVKNLMSPQQSKKTIPTVVDPNDKIMRDQTDEFLKKHQYLIHREEFDCQKVPVRHSAEKQFSESKGMKMSSEKVVKPSNYSHESSIPDEIKKIPSSKKNPTVVVSELTDEKISEVQTETLTKQPNVKPRKNLREKVKEILTPSNPTPTAVFYYDTNSEMDSIDKNSEQQKRDISGGEINKSNSPLSDDHTSSDVPSDISSLSVRQKKKVTFSQSPNKDTTNDSEGNVEEKNGDMSSDFTNITSSQRSSKPSAIPRKQIRKKVNAVFIDSAEIFKQDKERYLIQETSEFLENHRNHQNSQWIDQYSVVNLKSGVNQLNKVQLGDSKPKPSPRSYEQVTTSSPTLPQKTAPSEIPDNTYFETRRNLLLFLDDHRAYHDRERNYFISFLSKQNKPIEDDRKTTSKEPKLKAKLMSKIKSLVGHSEENINLDKKRDIENALLRKQTLEFLISQKCYNDLEGDACYKFYIEYPDKRGSGSLGSGKQKDNSNFQEDSTFCSPRKLPVNGSPESQIKKNQKPLKSSLDEKVSKTDKIKTKEVPYSKINQQNESTNYLLFMDQSKNFLDSQRNYINTENKIWCQYLKYKPEAGWSRITPSESIEKSNESRYISTTLNAPIRKSSSQIESEKIDHEVILHKTNLFLTDHKRFHDNLQMESSKFASQQTKPVVESKIKKKGEGVFTKVKSLLPSGHTKNRSYDIQKADGINQNTEGQKNIYVERKENLEVISSSKQPETDIKELTKNFLIDHQEYHNQEKLQSKTRLSKEEEKEKKSKKGVMSKIKSLVIGDSHKKIPSKKPMNSVSTENVDEPDIKISDEKKRISIREYTSSPETYRRNRPKHSQVASSREDQETKSKQEILDNKKPTIVKNEEFRISSISSSERQLHPLEKIYASTEGDESTNSEIFEKVESSIHSNQLEVLPGDEKRRYAAAKIRTQDFLLNEKQNLDIIDKVIMKESEDFKNNISPISFTSNADSVENIPLTKKNKICQGVSEENTFVTNTKINSRTRVAPLPSAPSLEECEDLSDREKENINSVIHRVVTPLSPTKTIFKEIRKREDSPDRKVYIVKEGYMITKENKDDMSSTKDARTRIDDKTNQFSSIERQPYMKDGISGEKNISLPRNFVAHLDGSASPITKARNEGQDYVDRSFDSPSQAVPQGDLEVRRHHTKNCYFIFLVVLVVLIAIYCIREDEDEI